MPIFMRRGKLRAIVTDEDVVNISPLTDIAWRMVKDIHNRISLKDLKTVLDDTALILIKADLNNDGSVNYDDILAFDPSKKSHVDSLRFDYEKFNEEIFGRTIIESYGMGHEDLLQLQLKSMFAGMLNFAIPDELATEVKISASIFGNGSIVSSNGDFNLSAEESKVTASKFYKRSIQKITLTAKPSAGTKIHSWDGCEEVSADLKSCKISLSKHREVVVNFVQEKTEINDDVIVLNDITAELRDDVVTMVTQPENREDIALLESVKAGKYIVSTFKSGFLRKVTKVEKITDVQYRFSTVDATLEEIIQQGTGIMQESLTHDDLPVSDPAKPTQRYYDPVTGNELVIRASERDNKTFELGYYKKRSKNNDKKKNECFDKASVNTKKLIDGEITLKGSCKIDNMEFETLFAFNIDLGIGVDFDGWKVQSFKVYPKIIKTYQAKVTADLDLKKKIEREVFYMDFAPQTFWIGYVPIVVVPKLTITLTAEGEINAQFTVDAKITNSIGAGILISAPKPGQSKPDIKLLNNYDFSFEYNKPQYEYSAEANIGADIGLSFLFYGAIGPEIIMAPYVQTSGKYVIDASKLVAAETSCDNPYFSVNTGISLDVAVRQTIATDSDKLKWLKDALDIRKPLLKKSWPMFEIKPDVCKEGILDVKGDIFMGEFRGGGKVKRTYTVENRGDKALQWYLSFDDFATKMIKGVPPHKGVSVKSTALATKYDLKPKEKTTVVIEMDLDKIPMGDFKLPVRFIQENTRTLPYQYNGVARQSSALMLGKRIVEKDIFIQHTPDNLPAPANVRVDDTTVTWDPPQQSGGNVEYITGYRVVVTNPDLPLSFINSSVIEIDLNGRSAHDAGSQSVEIKLPDAAARYEVLVQSIGYGASSDSFFNSVITDMPVCIFTPYVKASGLPVVRKMTATSISRSKNIRSRQTSTPRTVPLNEALTLHFDANQKLHQPEIVISDGVNTNTYSLSQAPDGNFTSWRYDITFSTVGKKTIKLRSKLLTWEAIKAIIYGDWFEETYEINVVDTPPPVIAQATKLNDTGITKCGTANRSSNSASCADAVANASESEIPLGQDGHYGTGINGSKGMSFSKVTGYEGKCVLDNHTGLMWEVKQGGDGTKGNEGLHDADDEYNWYSDVNNGGIPGYKDYDGDICFGYDSNDERTFCNTQAYVARVNAAGWCGYRDWRMPTREELRSIVDYSRINPAIDTSFLPNTQPVYWSSSPDAGSNSSAWVVYFSYGYDNYFSKYGNFYVRLVRGGQ